MDLGYSICYRLIYFYCKFRVIGQLNKENYWDAMNQGAYLGADPRSRYHCCERAVPWGANSETGHTWPVFLYTEISKEGK